MTAYHCLAILLVVSSVVGLLVAVRMLQRRYSPGPECTRKLMHLGSGLIALALPYLFDKAEPVLLLAAITFAGLLALRHVPALKGLHSVISNVNRSSVGELCIPVAVAFLFVACEGDLLLYSLPLLAMTFADSAAAVVGARFGKIRFAGGKSLEGSLAFFAVTFLAADLPLCLFESSRALETLLLAMLFAVLLTAIEAASGMGLDNLFVPVGGFVALHLFADMTTAQLAMQIGLATSVLALAFFARLRPLLRGRLSQ